MHLSEIGEKVNDCWQEIPNHFPQIVLHEYVIMPNHVHGIIEINNPQFLGSNMGMCTDAVGGVGANNYSPLRSPQSQTTPSLSSRPNGTSRTVGSVVRGFKIGVTKQMGFSPWQRNYYEHIIRNDESYQNIVQYMAQNPMKWEEDCFYYEAQKTTM
jgi:REP element-mobilizing transposase RayT